MCVYNCNRLFICHSNFHIDNFITYVWKEYMNQKKMIFSMNTRFIFYVHFRWIDLVILITRLSIFYDIVNICLKYMNYTVFMHANRWLLAFVIITYSLIKSIFNQWHSYYLTQQTWKLSSPTIALRQYNTTN